MFNGGSWLQAASRGIKIMDYMVPNNKSSSSRISFDRWHCHVQQCSLDLEALDDTRNTEQQDHINLRLAVVMTWLLTYFIQ
jgi:hypothetical protein